jgi:hypothetical protein
MIGYLKGMIRGYSKGKDGFSLKFEISQISPKNIEILKFQVQAKS